MKQSIHRYYKKNFEGLTIIVRVNPENLTGLEIITDNSGKIIKTERQYDDDIYEDLSVDGFSSSSPLEFNLYLKGLIKKSSNE